MKPFAKRRDARLPIADLEVVLHDGQPLRLVDAGGYRLCCTQGCIWLTTPGEPRDIYLFAGDTWELRGDGLALLEPALGPSAAIRFEVTGPAAGLNRRVRSAGRAP